VNPLAPKKESKSTPSDKNIESQPKVKSDLKKMEESKPVTIMEGEVEKEVGSVVEKESQKAVDPANSEAETQIIVDEESHLETKV